MAALDDVLDVAVFGLAVGVAAGVFAKLLDVSKSTKDKTKNIFFK